MRRSFKYFQRKELNNIKSQKKILRIYFTHFFAFLKTMQDVLNLMQVLQRHMIAIIQFKFFTRARRFLNKNENKGIKILETKIKKERNNYYEFVENMRNAHRLRIL